MITELQFKQDYPDLYILLVGYFATDADFDIFDDTSTIKKYLQYPCLLPKARLALSQVNHVLKLQPFPEELISQLAWFESSVVTMKEWLEKHMIPALEARIKEVEALQSNEQAM